MKNFSEFGEADKHHLVDYFNLEYGLTIFDEDDEVDWIIEDIKVRQFTSEHFEYLGIFAVDGVETKVWAVGGEAEGENVFAIVQQDGESLLIGMTTDFKLAL